MDTASHESERDVDRLLDLVLTLPTADRSAYLENACAGDDALRARVVAILGDSEMAAFLERPAAAFAAPLLEVASPPAVAPDGGTVELVVGPYRVLREIGRGGMGAVYLAERADGQFRQGVALKLIRQGADDDTARLRFLRERQILAGLHHPSIARLGDGGITDGGVPWFTMEYVEGEPITAYAESRQLPVGERLTLFLQVCEAVRFAHVNLVVHRDLKPSNILVTAEGWVKLLDFGISKLLGTDVEGAGGELTDVGTRLMTPDYAAPEQVRGDPVTTATDVYALGTVLYELLTGQRAQRVSRTGIGELERVVCEVEPPPPSTVAPPRRRRELRGDLDTIVAVALRKEPSRRYPSVEALAEDVRRHTAGLPVRARPDSWRYRAGKFTRRHRLGVAAVSAVFVALMGGVAGTMWQARAAAREAARALREAAKATEVKDFVVGLFELASPAESRGRDITARELLERGTRRVDSALAGQPDVREEMLSVLASIYSELGYQPQSDTLARRALALARELHGDDHPETATRLSRLGGILWEQGNYAAAESVLTRALAIRRRLDDDTLVAQTLNVLAAAYAGQGQLERSVALDREVLAIDRLHYGEDHLEVALDLNNLGMKLLRLGQARGADSAVRAAYDIWRRQLDPDHPDMLVGEHNLATVLAARHEYAQAEALERDVLARRRRLYPQGHGDVGYALHQLAHFVTQQGRLEEADSLLIAAIAMRRQWRGPDHPETMTSVHNRAVVNRKMGRLDVAETLARQALAGWERSLGVEHHLTIKAMITLGGVLRDQERYGEAERTLRQALASPRKAQAGPGADEAQTLLYLGSTLRRSGSGRVDEAERLLRESIGIYQHIEPVDEHMGEALTELGTLLTDLGRAAEAESLPRAASRPR
jgi:serine/threonine-protein kinase